MTRFLANRRSLTDPDVVRVNEGESAGPRHQHGASAPL